jgi:hypothetical protein
MRKSHHPLAVFVVRARPSPPETTLSGKIGTGTPEHSPDT